jgi:hypothetical protein
MTISPVRSVEIQYLRQDEERCPVVAHVWSAKRKLREDSEGRPFHRDWISAGNPFYPPLGFGLVDAFEFAILLSSDKSPKDLELFISAINLNFPGSL